MFWVGGSLILDPYLGESVVTRVVRMIISGKAYNPVQAVWEMKDITAVEASAKTMRRALKEAGMKAAVKKKKLRSLPRHVRQRMEFALGHQHWTVEDWKRVIWSDEKRSTGWDSIGVSGCGKDRKKG